MEEPPVPGPTSGAARHEPPRRGGPEISRRAFLGGAAGVAGIAGLAHLRPLRPYGLLRPVLAESVAASPSPSPGDVLGGPSPDLVLSVERPSDMVVLDFFFYGFQLQSGTPPAISPTTAANTIVVQFPPQAVAEGSYFWQPHPDGSNELPVDPPPVLSQVSGPSRLCFTLATSQSIPLTHMAAEDLLDWSAWDLVVPNAAQVNGPTLLPSAADLGATGGTGAASAETRAPSAPTALETAIEFPYALYLAPVVYESGLPIFGFSTEFESRPEPLVGPTGVTDLWSAALSGASNALLFSTDQYVPEVSAFWARDYGFAVAALPDATPEHYIVYGQPEVIQ